MSVNEKSRCQTAFFAVINAVLWAYFCYNRLMTIKLIATDMDGTFLDGKGAYDKKRFDRLLSKLAEQEIWFVAASGR